MALRRYGVRLPGAREARIRMRFGDVGSTRPLSAWGSGRGTPIDRWYIERFLESNSSAIHGHVLEVKEDLYGSRFGARQVDVLDIDAANSRATIVGDMCDPATLPLARFDAAVITQTLQLVPDPKRAVRNVVAGIRRPGCLLLTVPCMSRLAGSADRWRWTPAGLRSLLDEACPEDAKIDVEGVGNGLAARGFLFGLAAEDLRRGVLAEHDPDIPLLAFARVDLGKGGGSEDHE